MVIGAWAFFMGFFFFFYPRGQMMGTSSCWEGECCCALHLGPHCHISVFWSSSSSVFLSVRMRPVRIRLCWLCRLCRVVLPILWHLLMRGPAVRRTKPRWSVADDTTGHTDSLPFCLVFLLVFASIIIPRSQPIPSGWGFWQAFSMSILP